MSVIKSTTKGKNERIELAATEKAKVCTSVRRRYLAVEIAIPEKRGRGCGTGRAGAVSVGRATTVVVRSGTGVCLILSKGCGWCGPPGERRSRVRCPPFLILC